MDASCYGRADGTSARRSCQAGEIGESKDRFLAGVSHERCTPLTAVVGYASILKSIWPGLAQDEREDLLDVLHQQSEEVAHPYGRLGMVTWAGSFLFEVLAPILEFIERITVPLAFFLGALNTQTLVLMLWLAFGAGLLNSFAVNLQLS